MPIQCLHFLLIQLSEAVCIYYASRKDLPVMVMPDLFIKWIIIAVVAANIISLKSPYFYFQTLLQKVNCNNV
jgi:hypothetical protein